MRLRLTIAFLLLLLAGCGQTVTPTVTPTVTIAPTPTLGQPEMFTTPAPDVRSAARVYLDAWKIENYAAMYRLLTGISQDAITEEAFTKIYRDVAAEAALNGWEYEITQSLTNPRSAQVGYKVTLHSVLVGDIQRDTTMNLSLEGSAWKVQWDPALILPELRGGNTLQMEYLSPSRGNIYDRNGHALVAQADAVAIGLDTGKVDPKTEGSLLSELYRLTGVRPESLQAQIEAYRPNGWYLPVADVTADDYGAYQSALDNFNGAVLASPFKGRYYFDEGVASHVVGYVSVIQKDDIEKYKRLGYNVWSDRVGQMGLEAWGESYLSGKRGGALYLLGPDGKKITRLAQTDAQPSQAIYTTIDRDLQIGAQQALGNLKGAVVVLERDTGRVLALASSPDFNPNLFEPQNANTSYLIGDLFDQNRLPLLDRATQGQYPLGSVFKIVTISAALQSGVFTTASTYNCLYDFTELPDRTLHDWTYDHFLKDHKTQPSGILTLPQGLMRSCNPWFWHIGLDFFNRGMTTSISNMARGFGLGQKTGIEIPEEAGNIPDPESQLDATNMAIGQGQTLVTPLQVADFVAAVGNGGTLYAPKVVEKIAPPDGQPTYVFTSTVRGRLPISSTVLTAVQDAMVSVIKNPRGTAYFVLNAFSTNYNIPIAGKTGTAESGTSMPHAWFAGYTYANRPNKPDIAVVVLVENGGEGSEVAAPIFRRVMEVYFLGKPMIKYPWESSIGVVPAPTPEVPNTPVPSETPATSETPTPAP